MRALVVLLALLMCAAAPAVHADDRHDVEKAVTRWLGVFENLDMPVFIECFTGDATIFFPSFVPAPEMPERVAGKAAVRSSFEQVFDAIRKGASGGAPYHRLHPEDLQTQMLGADSAIVTFHLRNSQRIARRTLVMRKVQGTWLIAHLHASNYYLPSATR
ncbi:MAG TPA: nuclear transport factor 2 family protein [Steroidobacteraceae bacterium]|nr:nuclear transport factor 2 family protein [Steroidobacteraceae bacterium]